MDKKEKVFSVLYFIFHYLFCFCMGGAIGNLIGIVITGNPLSIYGFVCCLAALPASIGRIIFQSLERKERKKRWKNS